jgi:plastocyanin
VNVEDNQFNPSSLTICLGDTVTWNWTGTISHSTTSGDGCSASNGAWDSGIRGTGSSFSLTFSSIPPECATDNSAGADTCSYYCLVHCSMMNGVITIADSPTAGLGISRNKLRITSDPMVGRGGTTLGAETLDGATYADVRPGTTRVTLTLSAPGLSPSPTATVLHFDGRFPSNDAQPLVIRSASIRATDVDLGKVTIKWETNGFDLSTVGPLTLTTTISHGITTPCGTGTLNATTSKAVSE